MTIQDSNPERRNLMVTSIAFIAFFYAGGSFPDSSVKLQVINADFSRPDVLAIIAWTALFWFLYRYWQIHNGDFSEGFREEFSEWKENQYIKNYVTKRIGEELICPNNNEGYHLSSVHCAKWHVVANCIYAENAIHNHQGGLTSYSSNINATHSGPIKLSGFMGWLIAMRAITVCMFKKPSFASYIVPYILSFLAILGGAVRYIF